MLRVPDGLDLSSARRCSAPASPPTRRCAPGTSARAAASAWSASAASATWRSSSPRRWAPTSRCISRTSDKEADALALGADRLLVSTDAAAMAKAESSFDLIIDTVPVKHDINPYLPLLDVDGTLVLVGQIGPLDRDRAPCRLLLGRRRVAGSPIGGIAETQEMLDFCAKKDILPDCEMIRMDQINEAFERMERADVRYRFVIDMATLRLQQAAPDAAASRRERGRLSCASESLAPAGSAARSAACGRKPGTTCSSRPGIRTSSPPWFTSLVHTLRPARRPRPRRSARSC